MFCTWKLQDEVSKVPITGSNTGFDDETLHHWVRKYDSMKVEIFL